MDISKSSPALLFIVIGVAISVLIGWTFNIEFLKTYFTGSVPMNPLTATLLIPAAISIYFIKCQHKHKVNNAIIILCLCIFLISLFRIVTYSIGSSLHVEQWLFYKVFPGSNIMGNYMAPTTALTFILLSVSILCLQKGQKYGTVADTFALLAALNGLLSVTAYLYRAREFFELKGFYPMAFSTAWCFISLSISLLSYKKEAGFTKEVTSKYGGKQIASLLIPVALIVPFFAGYLKLQSDHHGYISPTLSTAIVAIVSSAISIFVIWKISASSNRLNVSLSEEVEARKKIENELTQTNLFIDTILENLPICVFIKRVEDFQYIRVNKETEKFLNLKREQLIGKTDYEIFSKQDADSARKADVQAIVTNKAIVVKEHTLQTSRGTFWVNTQKIPIQNKEGQPWFLIGIGQDVTEQKINSDRIKEFNRTLENKVAERTEELRKRETLFRSLLENGSEAIKMMDANGAIFFASASHQKLLGFTPEELIGRKWIGLVHPDDILTAKKQVEAATKDKGIAKHAVLRVTTKEDGYKWLEGVMTNLLHVESVGGIVCNFHDVTERLLYQKEKELLQQALLEEKIKRQKQITQAAIDAQEKERTAIGMELHDNINQVMGVIKLYLGMAIKLPASRTEMLDKSYENIELCISEIKKISKTLVSPNLKLGLEDSINFLVESVRSGTGINFQLSFCNICGKINEHKQLAFYRILQELLTNIVRYARAKNVTITFKEHEGKIILNVEDDGVGFDLTTTKRGIGLQNIETRVELLDGSFEIISTPGNGCNANVNIPIG